jgi:hypothetical protein
VTEVDLMGTIAQFFRSTALAGLVYLQGKQVPSRIIRSRLTAA